MWMCPKCVQIDIFGMLCAKEREMRQSGTKFKLLNYLNEISGGWIYQKNHGHGFPKRVPRISHANASYL